MDILKKIFPFAFKVEAKETNSLVTSIIIHVGAAIAYSIVSALLGWLLSKVPFVGALLGMLGSLVGLYCTGGVVLSVLKFCKVLK